ncbi:hypothetical protein GCM10007216_06780 [Thalassobacillus devorans]|uniref:Uncharacterized protein n=1 Tax=Thalassobacillus devorans TaxID=279813 RepID=A0ABQ1NML4_9BACI|nr:hypothetical protein [Thalassobacillus devorans]NIK27589.1 hypothetical protein [Thalassobacillus devorans]GGC78913.1 hypothetical protein GCM10007216_06780 [Thalassobacillus devorans]
MVMKKTATIINAVISGIVVFMISTFLAGGAIGENYTDKTFVAPEFFLIAVIWGFGALLGAMHLWKNSIYLFVVAVILMWLSIPLGIRFARYFAPIFT